MNTPTSSLRDRTAPDYHPSIIFHSYRNRVTDNNNIFTPPMPAISKNHSGQFVYPLAQEVRISLGHISLSVEMLESLIEDNDLKIYLGVIARNSIRMNDLINNFLTYQQADEGQIEKVSIHQPQTKYA
jgi:signal transduction histidine kinase